MTNNSRRLELESLLDKGLFFKIICGAGNEDPEDVKRLSIVYTLAGAKGIDVSASTDIVKNCMDDFYNIELIKSAVLIAKKLVKSNVEI